MSIRFTCPTCHAVLKIAEMIAEPRKVRCAGCSLVILVSPDEDAPNGLRTSVPEKPSKTGESEEEKTRQRNILIGVIVGVLVLLAAGIWWSTRARTDRAAIEGLVVLDNVLIDQGTITFVPAEGVKGDRVTLGIIKGRYQVSAAHGPFVGENRVEINSEKSGGGEAVAKRYNTESKLTITIEPGSITKDFDVQSR